jgi:hypothetical protein
MKKARILEWLRRYGPAEIISLVTTLVASLCIFEWTGSKAATAFAGTLGGNIGYFGTILASDVWLTRRKLAGEGKRLTTRIFLKIIRALLIEFGVAEILDSLFIRPALLYYLPIWMNDLTWGLIAGKFLADITFYIPAIISFELSRKKFRDFE